MLAISREARVIFETKPPYFLWIKNLDNFICKLEGPLGRNNYAKPLYHKEKWSRIDLLHNPEDQKIIGFDTLHSFPASETIARLFLSTQEEFLVLADCVTKINDLWTTFNPSYGFHEHLSFFVEHPESHIRLYTLNQTEEYLVPLNRELFVASGGKLLS